MKLIWAGDYNATQQYMAPLPQWFFSVGIIAF